MNKLLAFFIVTISLTGCVRKEILDDVNLETGSAYDFIDNQIRGTALVPVYMPDKSVENKTFSASSSLSRDFLRDVQRQSSDPLVTGSLKVVLFGEKLAKEKGILALIDSFQRDPSIGAGLYLSVTEGEAKNIIEGKYGKRGNAVYLSNLIRHNMKSKDLPKTNLQRFLSDFHQKGKSPYLPQIRSLSDDQIEISGMSFFRYGRVVETIPAAEMFYFKLLVDNYSEGTLKVTVDKQIASVESIRSKFKMKLASRNPYTVNVDIKVKAILNEYTGPSLKPKDLKNIESKVEKDIETECLKLIKAFQDKKIDPVGFGHFIKSRTRHFNFKKWDTDYQYLKVNVHADVSIVESGVIE
ncbi:Ger(x)C family spore germination protein [Neobacillus sp. PS2-9]|uniref:Ger(x)C family spore germination protein n=1 Tax=Neobacillus sp. PS2-9 TaxID=3070676 RepID=UPI0027E00849|nr:Ger(x)C family spore germination protein [Neobacillus sp. PS2-9]WML58131.1 Ger(x)C family spore germination protein [Neobacillus sp. PS2-9]